MTIKRILKIGIIASVLCSGLSYGYGMDCDKPTINAILGEPSPFSFSCTNTTGVPFGLFQIFPIPISNATVRAFACTDPVPPGGTCDVEGTFTTEIAGTYQVDFNDSYGGEIHYGIFCNNPNKGCVTAQVPTSLTSGYFNEASCSGNGTNMQCIAAGFNDNSSLIERSANAGSWANVGSNTATGIFNTASCTDGGATGRCIAGGTVVISGGVDPFLSQSMDGGSTWATINVSGLPTLGEYNAASCTGSGSTARCVAAGQGTSLSTPFVAQTVNGGTSWALASVSNMPSAADINDASCSGSGSTARCIVVGDDANTDLPLIAQSTDGGTTWGTVSVPDVPDTGSFNAGSCTGTGGGTATRCIAGGTDSSLTLSLLAQSVDGTNWALSDITSSSPLVFYGTDCKGSSSTAHCIAAGYDSAMITPEIIQTMDGGATWAAVTVPSLSGQGHFNSVSCTDGSNTAQCVAVGLIYTGANPFLIRAPLLVQSTDGGATWAIVTISGLPNLGYFKDVSCVLSGGTTQCVAVGLNQVGGHAPMLVQSINGGTWTQIF